MGEIVELKTDRWLAGLDRPNDEAVYVYCVVEHGGFNGPCKIGVAASTKRRLGELQIGNWRKLYLAWTICLPCRQSALSIEDHCLLKFRPNSFDCGPSKRRRLCSEWLDASPADMLAWASRVLVGAYDDMRQA